ncbi:hypothetical protein [uncultured Bacteroides sp.]|uniref:hypothetical protein n=1 Tax=uncultured Bacteroides sp. TaxID=162156 RepID=UPI002AA83B4E|nr:hypothetical protein [uncultured Bacteroides sp.]
MIIGSPIPSETQIGVDANGNTTMHGHYPSWADPNAMPRERKSPIGSSIYENN